jgi:hypothetical protein
MSVRVQQSVALSSLLIANHSLVPLMCNPFVHASQQVLEDFMAQYELDFPQLSGVNTISSYIFPNADLTRLTLIARLISLLYYIDDLYGDLPSAQGMPGEPLPIEVFRVIEDCCVAFSTGQIPPTSSSLAHAFQHLHRAIRAHSDERLFERIKDSFVEHLISVVRPSVFGWNPNTANIEDYIHVREFVSGAYLTTNLIEFAEDMYLSDDVIRHPIITKLRQAAARIGSLTNDLFSYEKEVLRCNLPMNLVRVIQQTDHCDFVTAAQTAIELINEETRIFFAYTENAQFWDNDTNGLVALYIQGLKYQLNMDWHWHISTSRYRSPESPFEELRIAL